MIGGRAGVVIGVAAACWAVSPWAFAGVRDEETVRAFIEHVSGSDSFDERARAFVTKNWAQRAEPSADAGTFIAESLAVLSEDFRKGLDAYDDEQYEQARRFMEAAARSNDPYVSANGRVFVVKSLVEQGLFVEARQSLEALLKQPDAVDLYTTFAAEMAYLRGFLALEDLEYELAQRYLAEMLSQHPDAGQRLRVSAKQILAELRRRAPERIGDVADLMDFAGRRLSRVDTSDQVQARQRRAIELLDRLIEEAEQNEQSGGGAGGSGQGNDPKGGQQNPSNPMQDSSLPGGGGGGMNLRSTRRARPGEQWGAMPPAEREKILQQLRESFPSRYRALVEQYYEELGKKP